MDETLPSFEETQPVEQQLPSFEETKPVDSALPSFEETEPVDKFKTPGQRIATVAEGMAGPIGTAIETAPIPGEDIVTSVLSKHPLGIAALMAKKALGQVAESDIISRQLANPVEHETGKFIGSVGALATAPELSLASHTPALTKVGAYAIKGAIDMGLIQGADEISKAMLGQGDPQAPVAAALSNVGASMLLGFGTGGLFSAGLVGAGSALKAMEAARLGTKLEKFLVEVGQKTISPGSVKSASKAVSDSAALYVGGYPGMVIADKLGLHKLVEKMMVGPAAKKASAYLGPMVLKVAATDKVKNMAQLMDYATAIQLGERASTKGVEALFKGSANEGLNLAVDERKKDKLRDFIENGGVDQQIRDGQATEGEPAFAKGGLVGGGDSIAENFPEQNILLNTARGRISGYLNSVKPVKKSAQYIYDTDRPDKQKDREYDKTLDLALNPLSILNHVKKGTLLPKHMQAFTSMYPELHQSLSKKMTDQIMKNKLDKKAKKPPYKIRQAMSLFLGSSLDSSFSPMNMQAAQAVFANQKAAQAPPPKEGAVTKLDDSSLTSSQARQKRANKI